MIRPRIAEIQAAVAEHYGIAREAMVEPHGRGARLSEKVRPRQVAMCLSVRLSGQSLSRIGQAFGGRDHTTVIHAARQVEARCRKEGPTRQAMHKLTKVLLLRRGAL